MKGFVDGCVEGFGLAAIIALPHVPIILLYNYFAKKHCSIRLKRFSLH